MTFKNDQERLLEDYVASFEKLDEMLADELLSPFAWQLALGKMNEAGFKRWRPAKVETEAAFLEDIYGKVPARFPRLFEQLLLRVMNGFFQQITNPDLWEVLISSGFIPFGKGPDVDYDPVCFDINSKKQGGDCRIVKIDHEEILCNFRIKVVAELAPSFYQLVLETISRSAGRRSK
jgi:hypothetical protein